MPLRLSTAAVHVTLIDARTDGRLIVCDGLASAVGAPGATVSIMNGPRCIGAVQFASTSQARRWKKYMPSGRAPLDRLCGSVDCTIVTAAPGSVDANVSKSV